MANPETNPMEQSLPLQPEYVGEESIAFVSSIEKNLCDITEDANLSWNRRDNPPSITSEIFFPGRNMSYSELESIALGHPEYDEKVVNVPRQPTSSSSPSPTSEESYFLFSPQSPQRIPRKSGPIDRQALREIFTKRNALGKKGTPLTAQEQAIITRRKVLPASMYSSLQAQTPLSPQSERNTFEEVSQTRLTLRETPLPPWIAGVPVRFLFLFSEGGGTGLEHDYDVSTEEERCAHATMLWLASKFSKETQTVVDIQLLDAKISRDIEGIKELSEPAIFYFPRRKKWEQLEGIKDTIQAYDRNHAQSVVIPVLWVKNNSTIWVEKQNFADRVSDFTFFSSRSFHHSIVLESPGKQQTTRHIVSQFFEDHYMENALFLTLEKSRTSMNVLAAIDHIISCIQPPSDPIETDNLEYLDDHPF